MLAFRPLFDALVELAEVVTLGRTPLGEPRVINPAVEVSAFEPL